MKYRQEHIHLTTQSVDKWSDWYVDSMGATVTSVTGSFGVRMINLDLGGFPIRISNSTGVEKKLSQERGETVLPPEGYHHLGFLVDDIDGCIKDLVSKGAKIETPIAAASPTMRCGFLRLPDGLRIEICEKHE